MTKVYFWNYCGGRYGAGANDKKGAI